MRLKPAVLIVGGTSGIGEGVARELAIDHQLVNISRSHPTGEVSSYFEHTEILDFLNGEPQVRETLASIKHSYGPFAGVVSCAGVQKVSAISSIRGSDLENIFQVNLFSNIFLVKHLLRLGLVAGESSLVFISSIASAKPDPGMASYSMTKAALDTFVKVAAQELAAKRIRVNAIRPGLVQTAMISGEKAYNTAFLEKEHIRHKLGFGSPDDVACLVRFLLSKKSQWMTGQCVNLDGGRTLGD